MEEIGLKRKYNIIVLTTIKLTQEKNDIGCLKDISNVQGVASARTRLYYGDIMVLYGNNKDIKRLLKEKEGMR